MFIIISFIAIYAKILGLIQSLVIYVSGLDKTPYNNNYIIEENKSGVFLLVPGIGVQPLWTGDSAICQESPTVETSLAVPQEGRRLPENT